MRRSNASRRCSCWNARWADLQPDVRRERRQASAQPLLTDYRTCLIEKSQGLAPKSGTAKAINYSLRHWEALTRYLNDGRLSMHNNNAERT